MLTQNQIREIRKELDDCARPVFLFDDDQDGLCSFLLFYRYKREGKGIVIKTTPKIDEKFVERVKNYHPDRVFILDVAIVEQEFLDSVKTPVIWIDHHEPLKRSGVKYYNPRIDGESLPTTYMCYKIVENDLWIAALGCVADWFVPDFIRDFEKQYPDLINRQYENPGDIIYKTKLGQLIKIFSFVLKGKTEDFNKCIKVLTRIGDPYEILGQKTPQGKFIYNRFEKINRGFLPLRKEIKDLFRSSNQKVLVYTYKDDKMSFTSELSNEMIYMHPDKIIVVAREKNDEMKCSIRSGRIDLRPVIRDALAGLEGYGGGHENACGANVSKWNFEEFIERIKKAF